MGNSEFVKPFTCSICHEAFAKINYLGDHVETVHILKQSNQENHLDKSESNCEEINQLDSLGDHVETENSHENRSDPKNMENSLVDQLESDFENIQIQTENSKLQLKVLSRIKQRITKMSCTKPLQNLDYFEDHVEALFWQRYRNYHSHFKMNDPEISFKNPKVSNFSTFSNLKK